MCGVHLFERVQAERQPVEVLPESGRGVLAQSADARLPGPRPGDCTSCARTASSSLRSVTSVNIRSKPAMSHGRVGHRVVDTPPRTPIHPSAAAEALMTPRDAGSCIERARARMIGSTRKPKIDRSEQAKSCVSPHHRAKRRFTNVIRSSTSTCRCLRWRSRRCGDSAFRFRGRPALRRGRSERSLIDGVERRRRPPVSHARRLTSSTDASRRRGRTSTSC